MFFKNKGILSKMKIWKEKRNFFAR